MDDTPLDEDASIGAVDAATTADSSAADGPSPTLPRLGVYRVRVDGSGLSLIVDAGSQALTHVRRKSGSSFVTATRYTEDPDGNGLAMEIEAGGAHYLGGEIVVFPIDAPSMVSKVAGGVSGKLCANSSFTEDGKLLYVQQDDPVDAARTRLKRASFGAFPAVSSIETIQIPPQLLSPSDPHQVGPSDGSGKLIFPAHFQGPDGWSRPAWLLGAAGAVDLTGAKAVACPICAGVCCTWPDPAQVFGATDPRFDHAGTRVTWMQQHPAVSFGTPPVHPFRQHSRPLPDGAFVELSPVGLPETTSQTFVEWRADDAEVVYWAIELEAGVVRQNLYRMRPDGSQRELIPLPRALCPTHPSYLDSTEIVFSAHHCAGPDCSCSL